MKLVTDKSQSQIGVSEITDTHLVVFKDDKNLWILTQLVSEADGWAFIPIYRYRSLNRMQFYSAISMRQSVLYALTDTRKLYVIDSLNDLADLLST